MNAKGTFARILLSVRIVTVTTHALASQDTLAMYVRISMSVLMEIQGATKMRSAQTQSDPTFVAAMKATTEMVKLAPEASATMPYVQRTQNVSR